MDITRQLRRSALNKRGLAPIQMTICWAGHRLRIGSGEVVRPEHWDEENHKVKAVKGSYYHQINPKLAAIEQAAEEALYAAEQAGVLLSEAALRAALEPALKPGKTLNPSVVPATAGEGAAPRTFLQLMDAWVQESARKLHPTTYRPMAKTTLDGLKATRQRFALFSQAKQVPLTLEGMDNAFYYAFREYVMDELGQEANTFGKHITRLRTFLAWCEDQDLPVNRRYRKFTAPKVYVGVDALTEQELRRIQKLDFHSEQVQQQLLELHRATHSKANAPEMHNYQAWAAHVALARDKFLECCYTGLRISDAEKLGWQHVKGQMIHIKAGKTGGECYIPFYDDNLFRLVELATAYEHRAPDGLLLPTCYRVNEFLKIVAQLAGITRLTLSSKVGRKTFVTLKLYQGVPTRMVMQATGHTTEASFNRYVGVDTIKLLQEFMRRSSNAA
ncbi:tyrosine-type recombinase/integrase [Hymenobacter sp. BT186]|uniref:Tyrosine-type recombinase/integrase n=1 Tax=Hymenobacter telluris TaxID=2816474 RepID=A0A939JCX0_9BACT|nr:tyrosine-type recombinase/integrase [Hymenobacter telluris]MBO0360641.1 tyrosine-type recombinase/integrase [Hymenobacter telluris]MBW3376668.1 tyrosine-type recombinase/integrase [Hymenobacter norwichensis]